MTMLVRRDPLTVPSLSRLFDVAFSEPFFSPQGNALASVEEGTLAIDISEDEKNVIVRASVPGFTKDDIEAEVHEGILTIKATRNEEKETNNERFYRRERSFTSMSRRVALPASVAEGETKGELKDGVLTLRLPKSTKPSPRRVSIN